MLVSVITPTWQRHDLLFDRCMPSVRAQSYQDIEHVVVSDGPDEKLAERMAGEPVVFDALHEHDSHVNNFGSAARNVGIAISHGDIIAYLDDDNQYRREHIALLVRALENPAVDFAYSRMHVMPNDYLVGQKPPGYGRLDTSLIAHRRDVIDRFGPWPVPGRIYHAPDWEIVEGWLKAGAVWQFVPAITVNYFMR